MFFVKSHHKVFVTHYFFPFQDLRRYCFILYVFVVSASPSSERLPLYRSPVQPLLLNPKYLLFTPKSCDTLVSTRGTKHGVRWGGRAGGVPWVAWMHPWPHAYFLSRRAV